MSSVGGEKKKSVSRIGKVPHQGWKLSTAMTMRVYDLSVESVIHIHNNYLTSIARSIIIIISWLRYTVHL